MGEKRIKTIKKLIIILVGLICLYGSKVPMENVHAEDENTVVLNGVTYTLSEDGTLSISGATTVTQDGIRSFDYQNEIKKVVVEDGITSVGNNAFYGCTSLESVDLPDLSLIHI